MDTVDLIIDSATAFYNELRKDQYGRYHSWEHCYKCFNDARHVRKPDYDYLSLHLAFYLASWGMYRGSSFLLQKDYKVHIPIVNELLKKKYDRLAGIDCEDLRDEDVLKLLDELEEFMMNHYGPERESVLEKDVEKGVSTTLITKILMGTLGCVPAYDRYFKKGVISQGVTTCNYNHQSLLKLIDFYEDNYTRLEKARKKLKFCDLIYPQMKMLDMGFWKIGFDLDENKGHKKTH